MGEIAKNECRGGEEGIPTLEKRRCAMTKHFFLGWLAILGLCFSTETTVFAFTIPSLTDSMIVGDYYLGTPSGKHTPRVDSSVVIINPHNQDAIVLVAILDDAENVLLCKSFTLSRLDLEEINIRHEIKKKEQPVPTNGVVAATFLSATPSPFDTPLVGYVRTFIRQGGMFIVATKEGMRQVRDKENSPSPLITSLFIGDLCSTID
jgi:hypothetical protein